MAGHSKWANIKHRKAAQDAKRGKIFTKIIKEVTIAAREGGPDIDANAKLRLAVQNAKGANLPKENIERAIKKGSGADGTKLEELIYEGYGPHGIAIYVECTTDNMNRTVSMVRSKFTNNGGSLGTHGSLEFLFDRKGVFELETEQLGDQDLEEVEMELIDGGAEEVEVSEGVMLIYTSFEDFGNMQKKLEELQIEAQSAGLQRIPKSTTALPVSEAKQVLHLIDRFEEDDDVQEVYHNLEMSDELIEALKV